MPRFNRRKKPEAAFRTYYKHSKRTIGTAYNIASKALTLASKVNRAMNVEYKHHDVYQAATATSALPTTVNNQLWLLNGIAQGDTATTRDGSSLKIVGINIKADLLTAATNGYAQVRVVLFRYKNPMGSTPAWGDLFVNNGNAFVHDFRNLDNIESFSLLYDRVHVINPPDAGGQSSKYFTINHSRPIKVRYSGAGSTASDISEDQIWMAIVSDRGANVPSFTVNARLRYVDN